MIDERPKRQPVARLAMAALATTLALAPTLFGCNKSGSSGGDAMGGPGNPEAGLNATAKGDRILVSVQVPVDHHAYLDKGKEGVLIPISFDWSALVKAGVLKKTPSLASKPKGSYEKELEATVLRGSGTFEFKHAGGSKVQGGKLRVRSQLCNDRTRVCYPPKYHTIRIGAGA